MCTIIYGTILAMMVLDQPDICSCFSQTCQNFWRIELSGKYPRVSSSVEAKLAFLNRHHCSATIMQTLKENKQSKVSPELKDNFYFVGKR